MNERIKELAEQVVGLSRLHGGEFALMGNNQVEKFAELIVKECIRLCDQVDLAGADDCMDKIRDHFGVDE